MSAEVDDSALIFIRMSGIRVLCFLMQKARIPLHLME